MTTSCVSPKGLLYVRPGVRTPNSAPRMRSAASAPRKVLSLASFLIVSLLGVPLQVFATPMFHMINEADPGVGFEEVRIRNFDSLVDLTSLNQSGTSVLGNNIGGSAIGVAALTFDGNQFHMITEAHPGVGFEEVRIRSFDSLADLTSLTQSSTSVLGNNIGGSAISVAGLAYDGNQFHMITEADPGVGFEEVRIRSFDSLADLIGLNQSSTSILGNNIGGSAIGVAGLTFDGNQFHMITEAHPGVGFEEVRIRSFDSLADLISLNQSSTSILGNNIGGSAFSVRALAFQADDEISVPEPPTLATLAVGLVGIGFARRRQRMPA